MGLKEAFMELQYEVLERWHPDKEIYLVRERSTNLLLIRKTIAIIQKEIYEQLRCLQPKGCPVVKAVYSKENQCVVYEEFIQGDTLQEILERKGKLSGKEARSYLFALCDILQQLHDKGIIHRDIHPKNIMITIDGRVKLIDFGIARVHMPSKNRDTVLMGTVGYAAPEQYGLEQTDTRTDIYALGVLLHVMLTGRMFSTSSITIKGKWGGIIRKCTKINPEKRYQTVQDLKEDLFRQDISYRLHEILQGLPGFRSKEKKSRLAIFLLGYPFTILWGTTLSSEIIKNIHLPMPQFFAWYSCAMFFSTVLPVVLLTDLFKIRTRLFRRKNYSAGVKIALSFVLGYLSVTILGIMLALYYNL